MDQVPASHKPTADGDGDNGTRVELINNATGGILEIETGADDELIRITESTSTSGTVEARKDYHDLNFGNSRFGAGVNNLTIRTHQSGDAIVRVTTIEPHVAGSFPVFNLPEFAAEIALRIEGLGPYDQIHLGSTFEASVHADVWTGVWANEVHLKQHKYITGKTTTANVDFDPNLGGGLGAGHLLTIGEVGVNCAATLTRLSGTNHTITVDNVHMNNGDVYGIISGPFSPATLIVEEDATIGELMIHHDAPNFVGNPVAFVDAQLDIVKSEFTSGRAINNGRMEFANTAAPSTIHSTIHEFSISQQLPESTAVVIVHSDVDVTALKSSVITDLNIPTTGRFALEEHDGTANVLRVASLDMGSTPTGTLDLNDNGLIVDYTGSSPHDYIRSLIVSGYNFNINTNTGTWDGPGIVSGVAAGVTNMGIGYAQNNDPDNGFRTHGVPRAECAGH